MIGNPSGSPTSAWILPLWLAWTYTFPVAFSIRETRGRQGDQIVEKSLYKTKITEEGHRILFVKQCMPRALRPLRKPFTQTKSSPWCGDPPFTQSLVGQLFGARNRRPWNAFTGQGFKLPHSLAKRNSSPTSPVARRNVKPNIPCRGPVIDSNLRIPGKNFKMYSECPPSGTGPDGTRRGH